MGDRSVLAGLCLAAVLCAAASAQAAEATGPFRLNIPAEPLADSLNELAHQSGLQLLVPSQLVVGLRAPSLHGVFTAEDALRQLLVNTGLRFEFVNRHTVSIIGASSPETGSTSLPGGSVRSAEADAEARAGTAKLATEAMARRTAAERSSGSFANCTAEQERAGSCRDLGDPAASMARALEEVVVTGSYFKQGASNAPALDVVTSDAIATGAQPDLGTLLARLPATAGNLTTGNSNDQGDNFATAINLRGLGPRATLVLLNGQRQVAAPVPGGQDSFSVDINSLVPQVLISRVEIFKDGASALYGSDAVAGVVNFVTRNDLNGALLDLGGGDATRSGRRNGRIGLAFGTHSDGISVTGGLEVFHQDQVYTRDVFGQGRISVFGQTSAYSNPGTFFVGGVATADPLCGSPLLGGPPVAGLPSGSTCRADLTLQRGMIAGSDRAVSYLELKHDLGRSVQIKVEVGAALDARRRTNGVGFPANGATFTVPTSNPGNAFGTPVTMNLRYGAAYLGTHADTESRMHLLRGRTELAWQPSDKWEVRGSVGIGGTDANVSGSGYTGNSRLQAALDCRGGASGNLCFNPFASAFLAPQGSALVNSPAIVDWLATTVSESNRYSLATFDVLVTGQPWTLPNGLPLQLAAGGQRRRESISQAYDSLSLAGEINFRGPQGNYAIQRDVGAYFAEVRIPATTYLDLSIAARYESTFGSTAAFNPKIGLNWHPNSDLTIAGSMGTSQRAPGLIQWVGGSSLLNIPRDPVTGNAQNGVPVRFEPSTGLNPEKSTNWNMGIKWTQGGPSGRASATLDYWSIDFKDLITTTNLTALVLADPNGPGIQRDPVSGQILRITAPGYFNANRLKEAGLDFELRGSRSTRRGALWASLAGTYMTTGLFYAAGTVTDLRGSYNDQTTLPPMPIARAVASLGWISLSGNTEASLAAAYTSRLVEGVATLAPISVAQEYVTLDLGVTRHFGGKLSASVGVVNLADRLPPGQGNSIYTANGLAYDLRGRVFQLGVRNAF